MAEYCFFPLHSSGWRFFFFFLRFVLRLRQCRVTKLEIKYVTAVVLCVCILSNFD